MFHSIDLSGFSDVVKSLLGERLPELGPGSPNLAVKSTLDSLKVEHLFAGSPVRDAEVAQCCLAGFWLHHDFLEESHRISQEISTPEGSYWHAIMHRREPDAENAKYWFRRVGPHPVIDRLAEEVRASMFYDYTSPFDFIDFCERVRGGGSEDEFVARGVQLIEWMMLLEHCGKKAV